MCAADCTVGTKDMFGGVAPDSRDALAQYKGWEVALTGMATNGMPSSVRVATHDATVKLLAQRVAPYIDTQVQRLLQRDGVVDSVRLPKVATMLDLALHTTEVSTVVEAWEAKVIAATVEWPSSVPAAVRKALEDSVRVTRRLIVRRRKQNLKRAKAWAAGAG